MHSKNTINETKSKKTLKMKLRLKMLVDLQPIYFLNVGLLGMLSKSSCATPCHFKNLKFSFRKTSHWQFLDVKLARFAVGIAAPMENNRSTSGTWQGGVVVYKYIHSTLSIH